MLTQMPLSLTGNTGGTGPGGCRLHRTRWTLVHDGAVDSSNCMEGGSGGWGAHQEEWHGELGVATLFGSLTRMCFCGLLVRRRGRCGRARNDGPNGGYGLAW
ncbi:hypothetical protein E2562_017457 [Oryza meyeriana var. granulata]|uniref:Uncharacterized protein n=1 Tax=Oryza meyeriana var. granulata TaxID=110450 RepID=A0A6G1DXZ3_9ORYZ|nr:hypothetical protein E2562_017457 [Oryza meyeriana var. granulata]